MTHPLQPSWDRTTAHLRIAARALGQRTHPALVDFEEMMDHNELGLAMEALEAVGDQLEAGPNFWRSLKDAADEMGLTEHSQRYAKRLTGQRPEGGA